MKSVKLFLLVVILFFVSSINPLIAQEEDTESPFSLSADFVNIYVWRGMYSDKAFNIQPLLTYSFKGFYVGSFGSTNLDASYIEFDPYIGATLGAVSLTAYDYYWGTNDYFDYDNETTEHILDLELAYAPEFLPLTAKASVLFYGDDKNDKAENNYSAYLELGYNFDVKGVGIAPFVGVSPYEGFYASEFAVVNMGVKASKEIKITDNFSVPIYNSIIFNPHKKEFFCVFGVTLK